MGESDSAHDRERRRYPRVRAKIPVELSCAGTPPMRTATVDISLCGCYVETMCTLQVGTRLQLVFSLANEKITATAIVVTRYPQVGNGIEFIDMTPTDRLKLSQYIEQSQREVAQS